MGQLARLFSTYVPRFMVAHKQPVRVSISAAVALVVLHWIYDKVFRPPRALRRIPQMNFSVLLGHLFRPMSINEFSTITLAASMQSPSGLCVRFDHNGWVVRVTGPEAAKTVLLKTDLFPKVIPAIDLNGTLPGRLIFGDNIVMLSGAHWKAQRKVANPAFHRSMPIALFGRLTTKMFTVMDQAVDSPIDINDVTSRITLDAIGLAGFNYEFNAIGDNTNDWTWMHNVFNEAQQNMLFFFLPFLDRGRMLKLFPKRRRAHESLTEFFNRMDDIINSKRQVLEEHKKHAIEEREKDLLTLMLESQDEGEGIMTNDELKSNLCIFFLAGQETTANALSFAIYYLSIHKDVQAKARDEAIRILGDDPKDISPDIQQVRSFPYIDMIIKETLRINPPSATMMNRAPVEDIEVAGTVIPKGTQVGVDIYMLHHNPTVWKDPETFDPERFRPGGEHDKLSKTGMPWIPFSSGGRQCIGINFGMDEQRVILSMLLRKYDWNLPEDSIHKDCLILSGLALTEAPELYIQFKRRY